MEANNEKNKKELEGKRESMRMVLTEMLGEGYTEKLTHIAGMRIEDFYLKKEELYAEFIPECSQIIKEIQEGRKGKVDECHLRAKFGRCFISLYLGKTIEFNREGVIALDECIELIRKNEGTLLFDIEMYSLAMYLGQCIITQYGGEWDFEKFGSELILIDGPNEKGTMVNPISKVEKRFKNGEEDSVVALYDFIPVALDK
ncbi:MAG: hypothetical protein ACLQQ4_18750 [Bacteroidia bacterium]